MVTILKKGTKKEDFVRKLSGLKNIKRFDANKYGGIITLNKDPLAIQKRMRDEWE
jgi:hypothetical protein